MSAVFEYTGKDQKVPKDIISLRFHSSVVEVESYIFADYHHLKDVVFNEGLRKIGGCAFFNCSQLEKVTFSSTIREIGTLAFSRCENLDEVSMSGIILKMEYDAFEDCPWLERFTFPIISARLDNIIQTRHYPVEAKIDAIRGDMIGRRGSEITFARATEMNISRNWNTIKQSLEKIISWISLYEMKEATVLLELALWKAKIDQVDDTDPTNRDACRIEVPGPVKNTILQYLS
jgi:hypothetical protein